MRDLELLDQIWKSKEPVQFQSGAYGCFKNNVYYYISKDVPLLKGLRDRFNLAKKVLTLGSDGRSKIAQCHVSGNEFSDDDRSTLASLVDRWYGMSFSTQELADVPRYMFMFSSAITYAEGGESYSLQPSFQYPSPEVMQFVRENQLQPGLLAEKSKEQHAANVENHKYGRLLSSEAKDGSLAIRFYRVNSERPDFSGAQSILIEIINKIYEDEVRRDRIEIARLSSAIRKTESYIFKDFDSETISETELESSRKYLTGMLQQKGYDGPGAEARIAKLKMQGRDLMIFMRTSLAFYGQEATPYSAVLRIWP